MKTMLVLMLLTVLTVTAAMATPQGDQATSASPTVSALMAMPDLGVAEMTTADLEATTGGHGRVMFVARGNLALALAVAAVLHGCGHKGVHVEYVPLPWRGWEVHVGGAPFQYWR